VLWLLCVTSVTVTMSSYYDDLGQCCPTFYKPWATLKSFMWPRAALVVSYSRIQAIT